MAVKKAGYAYLLSIVLTLYFSVMLMPVAVLFPWVYDLVPSTIISEGTILVPTLIFMLITPARLNDMLGFHKIRLKTILLAVLLIPALYPSIEFASLLTQFFVENAVSTTLGSSIGTLPPVAGILLIGVFGPFVEEVIFRGYFYHTFRLTGRIAASVLLSGILFGLMHMNLNQACYAAVLGIFFALAVEATGSTTTSFLMHMVFNSAETIMMYYAVGEMDSDDAVSSGTAELLAIFGINDFKSTVLVFVILGIIAAAGIVLALLILNGMAKSENRRPLFFAKKSAAVSTAAASDTLRETAGDASAAGRRLISIPLMVGIVLSATYIVVFDLLM